MFHVPKLYTDSQHKCIDYTGGYSNEFIELIQICMYYICIYSSLSNNLHIVFPIYILQKQIDDYRLSVKIIFRTCQGEDKLSSTVKCYGLNNRLIPFRFPAGKRNFLLPYKVQIFCRVGTRVNLLRREAQHSPPPSIELKDTCSCTSHARISSRNGT